MQDIIQMCSSFDASKSTKGASKLRRDLINTEIGHLRDLLPLPASTRQRLSQLQLMALVCVYVRKTNYFQQVFKRHDLSQLPTPNIGFSKAMNGFLMMMTQNGKLLYVSDNAAEYLGHSMEDLLIHGDSVYDIIDKQDHQAVQAEMARPPTAPGPDDTRLFLCRMNVSRNARRQMRFGDQKVIMVQGHFVSYLPLCTRNEPVLVATCTPIAMPETRECVVQGATNIFTSVHSMDMKYTSADRNCEFYLGYSRQDLLNISWYQLVHFDYMRDAQTKHRLITQSEQDRSCILLLRLQRRSGDWIWVHCVLQVKEATDAGQQPVIVCTNQVLSEREAHLMRTNSWLYHYYLVQSKMQYGVGYEGQQQSASRASSSSYYPPLMVSPTPSAAGPGVAENSLAVPLPAHQHHPQYHPLGIGAHSLTPASLPSPLPSPHPPYSHPHLYPHVITPVLDAPLHNAYHFPLHQVSSPQHHQQQQQQQQQQSSGNVSAALTHPHYNFTSSPSSHHYAGISGSGDTLSNSSGHEFRPAVPSAFFPTHDVNFPAGASRADLLVQPHIKTEQRPRHEFGEYHVKIETIKPTDPEDYRGDLHLHVKQESDPNELQDESSPPSPPKKRVRSINISVPPASSSHFPASEAQQPDWQGNTNRTETHGHTYTSVWANGWINTSYPMGITRLEHHTEASYDDMEQISPRDDVVGGGTLTATLLASRTFIRTGAILQHKNQFVSQGFALSYPVPESMQRVPDVTMIPDLSPVGCVLTPAPTPPDIKDAKLQSFFTENSSLQEQCVPSPLALLPPLMASSEVVMPRSLHDSNHNTIAFSDSVSHAISAAIEMGCDSPQSALSYDIYDITNTPQDSNDSL